MTTSQESTDRLAIELLLYDYAKAIDNGDYSRIGKLFEIGAVYDNDNNCLARGSVDVVNYFSKLIRYYSDRAVPLTQHIISDLTFTFNDKSDNAEVHARFRVFQPQQADTSTTVVTGHYVSRFKCIDGVWYFSEHHMFPEPVAGSDQKADST